MTDKDVKKLQDRIYDELQDYRNTIKQKSVEEVYNDFYYIHIHEDMASFVYENADDKYIEWDILLNSDWIDGSLLAYLCNQFMKTSYDIQYDDLKELIGEIIEDMKEEKAVDIRVEIVDKAYNNFAEIKDSYKDKPSSEIFDNAEEIKFYQGMLDYIERSKLRYEDAIILNNEQSILKTLYDFRESESYGFDKNNYYEIVSKFIDSKKLELEKSNDEEEEQE